MNKNIVLIGFHNEKALGVRYLANALTNSGYEPTIVFFKRFNSEIPESVSSAELDLLRDLIKRVNPLFVGLSVMSSLYLETTDKVTEMIRSNFDMPIVWGGVYSSLEPRRAVELGGCDLVLRGEGEISIVKLAAALENGEDGRAVEAVAAFNDEGEFVINPVGDFQQDIDEYGYPIIGGDNMFFIGEDKVVPGDPQLRAFSYELSASRGCPFMCSYCSSISLRRIYDGHSGKYVRFRSVDSVMEELNDAKKKISRLRLVHFWDEIFSNEDGWIENFCRRYKAEIGIPFRIWGHPLMVNERVFNLLVDAGLHQVVMGIQSGSPYIRKEIFHRNETQEQIIQASKIIRKCKVPVVYYDLMICHPFESEAHLKETFEMCLELEPPFKLNMHGLNFLPGTDIVEMAREQGLVTEEELDTLMYGTLKEQYDLYWGPNPKSFAVASAKNSWPDLIILTQFHEIKDKIIALAKDPEKNADKIVALKNKMMRKQKYANLWDKAKLVLRLSK